MSTSRELTPTEDDILRSARKGELYEAGDREVAGEFLCELITNSMKWNLHAHGLMVSNAKVTGTLDARYSIIEHPLILQHCTFSEVAIFTACRAEAIFLTGCEVPGFDGSQLFLRTELRLNHGFKSEGPVILSLADIRGHLKCEGGLFNNPEGDALNANGAKIDGDVSMDAAEDGRFESHGAVRLRGAKIGGQLSFSGGLFNNPEGIALSFNGATINGGVSMDAAEDGRFESHGAVRLLEAKIGGQLSCRGGLFNNPEGDALSVDGATIDGDVFFDAAVNGTFESHGEVRLLGTRIGGWLNCRGGLFNNPMGNALNAKGARINGDVFMDAGENGRFESHGNLITTSALLSRRSDADVLGTAFFREEAEQLEHRGIMRPADQRRRLALLLSLIHISEPTRPY